MQCWEEGGGRRREEEQEGGDRRWDPERSPPMFPERSLGRDVPAQEVSDKGRAGQVETATGFQVTAPLQVSRSA